MRAAALALALGAVGCVHGSGFGGGARLPPAPVKLFRIAWQRPFVGLRPLEVDPQERGGVAVDAERGLAFVGTRDGWLHAVRRDGTVAWELRAAGGFGQPAVVGDTPSPARATATSMPSRSPPASRAGRTTRGR